MAQAPNPRNGESSTPLMGDNYDGIIPQLFTSVPALNEAASYLAQTTSYFTRCFSDYSVEYSPGESQSGFYAEEMQRFSSGVTEASSATAAEQIYSDGNCLRHTESSSTTSAPSHMQDGITRTSAGDSSQNSGTLIVSSRTGQSGISIFQRIGSHSMVTAFSNHGPLYFVNTKASFSKMGLTCHIAKIHSEASVEKNAKEIKEYIEEIYWGSNKRVLLLGHSKGGVDAAAALSLYWSDLKDKVAGLALAQSPYGGSPIASDLLRPGQLGDYVNLRKLTEILICRIMKGDMRALEDLTYEKRREFLKEHHLPKELPLVSLHTEAGISPAVLATLSHVAHAELPMITPLSAGEPAKLPVVMPLGAAMAACAQLLQLRYGEKSDGLVTCRDAEVPGSVVVRPDRKVDHAWMVYSSPKDDTSEGDAAQVCEALLTLLVEVGQKKRHEIAMKDE
ncbi:uncharacterized protein LOC114754263 [Neltuma alba]|uniref:uncharacterized protein LOC114754263 n=1 Tax=Neltuma alba TaxID=207710 RepID=UPI0010A43D8C|nr:uncharacterized protein LOC114754263 [Prosopis alba]